MTTDLQSDVSLFSRYMALTGTPTLEPEEGYDPALSGKSLGIVNGSSWISLFATYFGRKVLPGVKLVSVGNEAVQLNFMDAYRKSLPCPPQINIDSFVRYSEDLVHLYGVDAILITCSTMNRAADAVRKAMAKHNVPVVQIDEAMMEKAVEHGGRILVVATHGPTVTSTQDLLRETAARLGKEVSFAGATAEEAFELLGHGDILGHNECVAKVIREAMAQESIATVLLAQLSMSVFALSFPDSIRQFGVPILNSGDTGFEKVREVLINGRI